MVPFHGLYGWNFDVVVHKAIPLRRAFICMLSFTLVRTDDLNSYWLGSILSPERIRSPIIHTNIFY